MVVKILNILILLFFFFLQLLWCVSLYNITGNLCFLQLFSTWLIVDSEFDFIGKKALVQHKVFSLFVQIEIQNVTIVNILAPSIFFVQGYKLLNLFLNLNFDIKAPPPTIPSSSSFIFAIACCQIRFMQVLQDKTRSSSVPN